MTSCVSHSKLWNKLHYLYIRAISPGQNTNKIAGDGGMKEGPHVPESPLERLELDAAADTHHLMNVDVAAGRGHVCKSEEQHKTQQRMRE